MKPQLFALPGSSECVNVALPKAVFLLPPIVQSLLRILHIYMHSLNKHDISFVRGIPESLFFLFLTYTRFFCLHNVFEWSSVTSFTGQKGVNNHPSVPHTSQRAQVSLVARLIGDFCRKEEMLRNKTLAPGPHSRSATPSGKWDAFMVQFCHVFAFMVQFGQFFVLSPA